MYIDENTIKELILERDKLINEIKEYESANPDYNKVNYRYKMMNEEYGGNCYAVANEIFSQNTDICAFIEESSLFSKPLTVGIYRKEKMVDVLHGTVFFAKCGKINIRSLSLKDIDIIYQNLWRYDAKSFSIYL